MHDGNMVDQMMSEEYWERMDPDSDNIDDIDEHVVVDEADDKSAHYVNAYNTMSALNKLGAHINFSVQGLAAHRNIREALVVSFEVPDIYSLAIS